MKLFHFVAAIILTVAAVTSQSCSSAEEAIPQKTEGYTLISRSDAQGQLDDLLDTNAYLDLDLSQPIGDNGSGKYSEEAILAHAIFYRFYKQTRVEDHHVVVDGTAADINISERAFNHCKTKVVDYANHLYIRLLSMGYTPDQAQEKAWPLTPESIELVRQLR